MSWSTGQTLSSYILYFLRAFFPKHPSIQEMKANLLYKRWEYAQASSLYDILTCSNTSDCRRIYHNKWNSYFKQWEHTESIQEKIQKRTLALNAYNTSLENQYHEETQANKEYVERKLEELLKKQETIEENPQKQNQTWKQEQDSQKQEENQKEENQNRNPEGQNTNTNSSSNETDTTPWKKKENETNTQQSLTYQNTENEKNNSKDVKNQEDKANRANTPSENTSQETPSNTPPTHGSMQNQENNSWEILQIIPKQEALRFFYTEEEVTLSPGEKKQMEEYIESLYQEETLYKKYNTIPKMGKNFWEIRDKYDW